MCMEIKQLWNPFSQMEMLQRDSIYRKKLTAYRKKLKPWPWTALPGEGVLVFQNYYNSINERISRNQNPPAGNFENGS